MESQPTGEGGRCKFGAQGCPMFMVAGPCVDLCVLILMPPPSRTYHLSPRWGKGGPSEFCTSKKQIQIKCGLSFIHPCLLL